MAVEWVRLWHDMPTDPKWRVIARKSGQPLACVIAMFTLIMTEASSADCRGSVAGVSVEDVAAALDMDDEAVAAILGAMQGRVINDGRLSGWERRQPAREDGSAERAKAWREQRKAQENNEERARTQPNAQKRPEKIREDTDKEDTPAPQSDAGQPPFENQKGDLLAGVDDGGQLKIGPRMIAAAFDEFWAAYPRKVEKEGARAKFSARVRSGINPDEIISGAKRYAAQNLEPKFIKHPTTWLNNGCWSDHIEAPLAMAGGGAKTDGDASNGRVFVTFDGPEWDEAVRWYQRRHNKHPPNGGGGWWFPVGWKDEKQ